MKSETLRIAYIVYQFDTGGLEHCVARLVNHLDPEHFEPMIVSLTSLGEAKSWIASSETKVVALDKPIGNSFSVIHGLTRLLRENQIDLVHSHGWGTIWETIIAKRCAGVKTHVHAERGTVFEPHQLQSWRHPIRARAMKIALGRADSVISVADATRHTVSELTSFPREQIQVIPNGVDAPTAGNCHAVKRFLGIDPDTMVIGTIGRLSDVKQFDRLISAFQIVREQLPHVNLLIVGDGPRRASLERHANALGVAPFVHFAGNQNDVGSWLSCMDVYVNSSRSEGMSQAVLEALSLGIPCVVTDVGDHANVIGQAGCECGMVVPPECSEALSRAVVQMLQDDAMRDQFSVAAKANFKHNYGVGRMVRDYESLYGRVCSR
ncbi:MAG: glycosyltransferase [Pirellulaceae bacterium]|nr:glycosyltransferase [Pirellulaceae bacterium]